MTPREAEDLLKKNFNKILKTHILLLFIIIYYYLLLFIYYLFILFIFIYYIFILFIFIIYIYIFIYFIYIYYYLSKLITTLSEKYFKNNDNILYNLLK